MAALKSAKLSQLNLIHAMKWLAVLYDDQCGMCSHLRRWLEKQPAFVALRLVPLHSPAAAASFPGIGRFDPGEKLVVVADDGRVWRGDSAWITVLWALHNGCELALKLASPALRPLARKIVTAVSNNRLRLSQWLHLKPDQIPVEENPPESCALK
jgi:predicted DCC family thiol-disulfide oxidoreductase YuxK